MDDAAAALGVSKRTAYRRLAEPRPEPVDDPWEPLCMSAQEWTDWQALNPRSHGITADRPCTDCPHGFAAEMRAVDKCNGSPGGVEEDEDVDEHQAAGAAANAANHAARRETTSDLAEVSVAAPCGTCAHAAVCRIKATLDGWDEVSVRLPALDGALTVTLSAKVECSFYTKRKATAVAGAPLRVLSAAEHAARSASASKARAALAEKREMAARRARAHIDTGGATQ